MLRRLLDALLGRRRGEDVRTRLVRDVRSVFALKGVDRLSTRELLAALTAMPGSPWSSWGPDGGPMDARTLAGLLRTLGIRPRVIRIGPRTCRGYLLSDVVGVGYAKRNNQLPTRKSLLRFM